jgi:hypothetical protein
MRTVLRLLRVPVNGTTEVAPMVFIPSLSTRVRLGGSLPPLDVEVRVAFECRCNYSADINACLTQPCHTRATCTDQAPPSLTRTCTCNAGYEGNGVSSCTGLAKYSCIFMIIYRNQRMCDSAMPTQLHVHRPAASILGKNVHMQRRILRNGQQQVPQFDHPFGTVPDWLRYRCMCHSAMPCTGLMHRPTAAIDDTDMCMQCWLL